MKYKTGDKVLYNDKLYFVFEGHLRHEDGKVYYNLHDENGKGLVGVNEEYLCQNNRQWLESLSDGQIAVVIWNKCNNDRLSMDRLEEWLKAEHKENE